jgi:hypothetical protein
MGAQTSPWLDPQSATDMRVPCHYYVLTDNNAASGIVTIGGGGSSGGGGGSSGGGGGSGGTGGGSGGGSGGGTPAVPPVSAPDPDIAAHVAEHISGADRVQTSVAISRRGWLDAHTVILAPGGNNNLIDALAVAPLAGQENAPILLSTGGVADSSVIAEIRRLGARKIYAVGALSENVITQLRAALPGVAVETLQGRDRWETAALVSAKVENPRGSFIVGYNAIPDAVSAASYAAANGYLIQIARPDGTLESDRAPLTADRYILGGPALVRDIPGYTRLAGTDRYATNAAVLKALSFETGTVYTANGQTLVDALTGSALAAQTRSPIILTPGYAPAALPAGFGTAETQIYAFGG